jgi:hypothetical protein
LVDRRSHHRGGFGRSEFFAGHRDVREAEVREVFGVLSEGLANLAMRF